ncbi:translation initiation factor IF-2-like [Dipodomys spectabilis]|uniref:translation initiation factor IF-2-like n=1 Tax=Dipodomys spectabilis TaxID=105255 RepID=UPI001C534754|nr:translation initiation factor IF-2-like [Dipodomys spectabilis]
MKDQKFESPTVQAKCGRMLLSAGLRQRWLSGPQGPPSPPRRGVPRAGARSRPGSRHSVAFSPPGWQGRSPDCEDQRQAEPGAATPFSAEQTGLSRCHGPSEKRGAGCSAGGPLLGPRLQPQVGAEDQPRVPPSSTAGGRSRAGGPGQGVPGGRPARPAQPRRPPDPSPPLPGLRRPQDEEEGRAARPPPPPRLARAARTQRWRPGNPEKSLRPSREAAGGGGRGARAAPGSARGPTDTSAGGDRTRRPNQTRARETRARTAVQTRRHKGRTRVPTPHPPTPPGRARRPSQRPRPRAEGPLSGEALRPAAGAARAGHQEKLRGLGGTRPRPCAGRRLGRRGWGRRLGTRPGPRAEPRGALGDPHPPGRPQPPPRHAHPGRPARALRPMWKLKLGKDSSSVTQVELKTGKPG